MKTNSWGALALLVFAAAGCEDAPSASVAPEATALQDSKPKAAGAMELTIDASSGKVSFEMEAPQEKIRGRVDGTVTGTIAVDPTDITKTTAHLYVDIGDLELFQRKANDEGEFGPEEKSAAQNDHARQWLEIGSCDSEKIAAEDKPKCEEMTKKNRKVEFVITAVQTDQPDVTKLSGTERKVTARITGDFLLHQHKTQQSAKAEIAFRMDGDRVASVRVQTLEPFAVSLAEHDVRPREAFGVFAQKTLEILAPKVAKDALVSVAFAAKFAGVKAAPDSAAPTDRPAADPPKAAPKPGAY